MPPGGEHQTAKSTACAAADHLFYPLFSAVRCVSVLKILRGRLQDHPVSQCFQPLDQMPGESLGLEQFVMIRSQVAVFRGRGSTCDRRSRGDRMCDGHQRAFPATPARQPAELEAERYVPLAWLAAHAACTRARRSQRLALLVVPALRLPADSWLPGADPRPARQWSRRRKGTGSSASRLPPAAFAPRGGRRRGPEIQQFDLTGERRHRPIDPLLDPLHQGLQLRKLVGQQLQQEPVVLRHPPLHRLAQRLGLAAEPACVLPAGLTTPRHGNNLGFVAASGADCGASFNASQRNALDP